MELRKTLSIHKIQDILFYWMEITKTDEMREKASRQQADKAAEKAAKELGTITTPTGAIVDTSKFTRKRITKANATS